MPGALTWDPTPPGGSQSTSRGGVNPAADGASLSSTEVAATRALVSGDGVIYGAPKMRKFLAALGRAAYERVGFLYHSTSLGAGVDAASSGNDPYTSTDFAAWDSQSAGALWAKMLSANVGGTASSAGSVIGGTGAANNPIFTYAGGATTQLTDDKFGPAGVRAVLSGAAHTMAFAAVGTAVRVYAVTSGAPSTVQARWSAPSVSGGATQTVAVGPATPTPENDRTWLEFTISPVVPGETVTLIGPTSSSYSVYYVDRDYKTTPGVTIHRLCQPGASLTEIHAAALDSTDTAALRSSWIGSGATAVNRRLGQAQSMSVRVPSDGFILHTDVNDLNEWANYGYTLNDLKRHLSNYLSYHAGLGLQGLVLCGPVRDPSFSVGTRPYDQADVIAAYKEVCAASTNAGFMDLTAEFTGATLTARYNAQSAAGVMQDIVHWNKVGHAYAGTRVPRALLSAAALMQAA